MNKSGTTAKQPAARRRLLSLLACSLVGAGALALPAHAESNFPNRPIKLVVPYNAGGVADALGRALAEEMKKALGQPVIVDNKAGANTAIGASTVARSPADGYTVLLATAGTLVLNPLLVPQLSYKPEDFAEIYNVATTPIALTVKSDGAVNNYADLMDAVRKGNGKVAYASTGIGSTSQLAGELLQIETNTRMIHVPYNGSAPALTAVMGGDVLLSTDSMASAIGMYAGGRLKPIAVTSKKRAEALPDVPTLYELGLKSFDVSTWYGVVAPAKTPADIVAKLQQAVAKAATNEEFIKRFGALGLEVQKPHAPADFKAFMERERNLWRPIIKDKNIQIGG